MSHRPSLVAGILVMLALAGACVADDPTSPEGTGSDAGSEGSTTVNESAANAAPTYAAQGVSFVDVDPKIGTVGGTVVIQKASDESDVTAYLIYSGTDATHKSSPTPLATLSATGKNLSYHIAEGTVRQPGVTTLLVYTQNAAGEMATGVSTPFADAVAHYVPIGDPDAGYLGGGSRIAFDEVNRKLLIMTSYFFLFRCELDGTGCVKTDISSGHNTTNSTALGLAVDPVGQKVLAVGAGMFLDGGGGTLPALFRANLDGTSPSFADVSLGKPADTGDGPTVAIDTTRNKLEIIGQDIAGQYQPVLFECNLDGSSCTFRDLSTGTGEGFNSGGSPSAIVDPVGKNLLVATYDVSIHGNPTLWICPLAGGDCATEDVSTALGSVTSAGTTPTIMIDATAAKIDIVTANEAERPFLFRCNLDGSNCLASDLTTGTAAGDNSAQAAGAVFDALDGKIGVLTEDRNAGFRPSLFRCNADGTGCTYTDISGTASFSALSPYITVDPETGQLFGLAEDGDNYTPSLFFMK